MNLGTGSSAKVHHTGPTLAGRGVKPRSHQIRVALVGGQQGWMSHAAALKPLSLLKSSEGTGAFPKRASGASGLGGSTASPAPLLAQPLGEERQPLPCTVLCNRDSLWQNNRRTPEMATGIWNQSPACTTASGRQG